MGNSCCGKLRMKWITPVFSLRVQNVQVGNNIIHINCHQVTFCNASPCRHTTQNDRPDPISLWGVCVYCHVLNDEKVLNSVKVHEYHHRDCLKNKKKSGTHVKNKGQGVWEVDLVP